MCLEHDDYTSYCTVNSSNCSSYTSTNNCGNEPNCAYNLNAAINATNCLPNSFICSSFSTKSTCKAQSAYNCSWALINAITYACMPSASGCSVLKYFSCTTVPNCSWSINTNTCVAAPACSLLNQSSCTADPNCSWSTSTNACVAAPACSYTTANNCSADSQCTWVSSNSTCVPNNPTLCQAAAGATAVSSGFKLLCNGQPQCTWTNNNCVAKSPACSSNTTSSACGNQKGCTWYTNGSLSACAATVMT